MRGLSFRQSLSPRDKMFKSRTFSNDKTFLIADRIDEMIANFEGARIEKSIDKTVK
jgi:hypothetical protein